MDFLELYEHHIAHELLFHLTIDDLSLLRRTCKKLMYLINISQRTSQKIKCYTSDHNVISYRKAMKYIKNNGIVLHFFGIHSRINVSMSALLWRMRKHRMIISNGVTIELDSNDCIIDVSFATNNMRICIFNDLKINVNKIMNVNDYYDSLEMMICELRKFHDDIRIRGKNIRPCFIHAYANFEINVRNKKMLRLLKKEFHDYYVRKIRHNKKGLLYLYIVKNKNKNMNCIVFPTDVNKVMLQAKDCTGICLLHSRFKKFLDVLNLDSTK